MPCAVIRLSYNGKPFCGFAKQTKQSVNTVQEELEHALSTVFRRKVDVVCAGRTDTGVHALDQVVSFTITEEERRAKTEYSLIRSLNALTSDAISVRHVLCASDDFSARFSAVSREYRYFFSDTHAAPLVMQAFSAPVAGNLNVETMNRAAHLLVGTHDFESFCVKESAIGKNTTRTLYDVSVSRTHIMGDDLVCLRVVGNAFLHSMIRTLAGTLVMVGRGLREPAWITSVLKAKDRCAAGPKFPACGLIFWHVNYGNALEDTTWDRAETHDNG